jgi:signal transduction histidine kinase
VLRRTPSLALRAVLTFTGVYIAALAVFLVGIVAIDAGDRNKHAGLKIAAARAANDLVRTPDGFRLRRQGAFAEMASRNPSMWLLAQRHNKIFSIGRVPEPVVHAIMHAPLQVELGRFYIPGGQRPSHNAVVIERRKLGSDTVILAVGGVDPNTIGFTDVLGAAWGDGILSILVRAVVVGFAGMLIALPVLSRALRPLAAEAAAILPQESGRRLNERKAPREVLPLVRGFNAALDRLATELGRRKRFIADAAHELRTPLAVVALRVEALKDENEKIELRRGVDRLVHLVSQMLDVERSSLVGRERLQVDLVAITRDVIADFAPTAINSGYDLSLDAPQQPVDVVGDAHAISRAITNLIGNAVAHGGGAGHIRVVVRADRTVEVLDEGPGVESTVQARLFEPFSRGSSNAEGCGLGLHLTREIMSAHGGEVRLMPSQRGAQFRLSFASPTDGRAEPARR